jgi:hypothetical protein
VQPAEDPPPPKGPSRVRQASNPRDFRRALPPHPDCRNPTRDRSVRRHPPVHPLARPGDPRAARGKAPASRWPVGGWQAGLAGPPSLPSRACAGREGRRRPARWSAVGQGAGRLAADGGELSRAWALARAESRGAFTRSIAPVQWYIDIRMIGLLLTPTGSHGRSNSSQV